jgi:hypothetical protein
MLETTPAQRARLDAGIAAHAEMGRSAAHASWQGQVGRVVALLLGIVLLIGALWWWAR